MVETFNQTLNIAQINLSHDEYIKMLKASKYRGVYVGKIIMESKKMRNINNENDI